MLVPSACINTEQRKRLSHGSMEAQTSQGHAMTGTPCDVPEPNILTVIFMIAMIFMIFTNGRLQESPLQ